MTLTHVALIVLGVLALAYAYFGLPRRKGAPPLSSQAGILDSEPHDESDRES